MSDPSRHEEGLPEGLQGQVDYVEILDDNTPNMAEGEMDMDDDMEDDEQVNYELIYDPDDPAGDGEESGEEMGDMEMEGEEDVGEIEDNSVAACRHHTDAVYTVGFSPTDPTVAISGGGDDVAYLWNATNGQKVWELRGHTDSVTSVSISGDGKYAATGGMDGQVLVWDVQTGTHVVGCEGCTEVEWVAWHPRGAVVIAGSSDGNVWMWRVPSGHLMNVFAGHTDTVRAGTFTPDGKGVVTVSSDMSLVVWDPKTAEPRLKMAPGAHQWHEAPISCLDVHSDSIMVITGAEDGQVKITNTHSGKVVGSLEKHTDSCEAAKFSPTHPYAATGALDGSLCIWETSGALHLRHTCTNDGGVVALAWHPKQPVVFSGSVDRTVRAWDARTGQLLQKWTGHRDSILSLAVSSDGSRVLTGSDDHQALVFAFDQQ